MKFSYVALELMTPRSLYIVFFNFSITSFRGAILYVRRRFSSCNSPLKLNVSEVRNSRQEFRVVKKGTSGNVWGQDENNALCVT